MLYSVSDFYIEAESEREAFLKYAGIRYDIYRSKNDKTGHDDFFENWCNNVDINEKIIKIAKTSADEYFSRLLEYVYAHCPGSYFNYSDHGTYEYDGILILTEDENENAIMVAAYHEGNGVYSVGPGLTGIGYITINRLNCCENFKEFLTEVNKYWDTQHKYCTVFKESKIQF